MQNSFVVMDGVGIGDGGPGDAVKRAFTPTLDDLMANRPWIKLEPRHCSRVAI